jgi:UDP:flavonoid glycosyltransferase YjiC (YdhE family)
MVVSGVSEDKATTNAIVQWSGVGINLGEQSPGAEKIREAVAKILEDNSYQNKAKTLSKEYEKYDVEKSFDGVIQNAYRDWRKKKAAPKSEL